jgi:acyl-CoA thioester hydrolase
MTEPQRSSSSLRVRYAETDQMGIAYHGNFFAWFEVGRTDLLRGLGMTYRDLEARDVHLPVIETHVRFLKPALYDDTLEIRTRLVQMTGVRLVFEYDVHRSADDATLARGTTSHAAVDSHGRPRRLPEELRARLA